MVGARLRRRAAGLAGARSRGRPWPFRRRYDRRERARPHDHREGRQPPRARLGVAFHQLRVGVLARIRSAARRTRISQRCGCRRRSGREAERDVLAAVTQTFPGVTAINVRDAIESVNAIVAELALAVRVAASLALIVSMLVLGGALAAGHRQRRQDAVILKTLGATRPVLLSAFSLEYGLLGIATALFAIIGRIGGSLVRGEASDGAGIHDLSERRSDRRRNRARRHSWARACRDLADPLSETRPVSQKPVRAPICLIGALASPYS